MGITINPFSGLLEVTGGGGSDPHFHTPVATEGNLPGTGISGEMLVVEATDHIYVYDTSLSKWVDTGITSASVGNSPNVDGYSLTADSSGTVVRNKLILQPADSSNPGIIAAGSQNIPGLKAFDVSPVLGSLTANTAIYLDGAKQIQSSATTDTELSYVSGVTSAIQTQLDSKIPLTQKAANNGVASLDSGGKIPVAQLPNTVMEYQQNWDPTTNIPVLTDGTGTAGNVYRVSTASAGPVIGLSDPSMINFQVGNLIIYAGALSQWQQSSAADGVISVNGQQGAVSLTTDDVPEGSTNEYFTDIRAQAAVQTQLDARVLKSGDTMSGALDMAHNNIDNIGTANFTSGSNSNSSLIAANNIVALRDDGSTNSVSYFYSVVPSDSDLLSQAMLIEAYSTTTGDTIDIGIAGKDIHLGTEGVIDLDTYSYGPNTLVNYGKIENSSNNILITATTGDLNLTSTSGQVKSLQDLSMETHQVHNVVDPTSAQDAATKHYVDVTVGAGPGDITPSSFSFANNQASPANVTGLDFSNAAVGNFKALVGIKLLATSSLYGTVNLIGTQKGASWDLSYSFEGDDTGLVFSITNSGQIQYQSNNTSGFTSGTIKFSAQTLAF